MKKITNNIILMTFPLAMLISLSYYFKYTAEYRHRLDRFGMFHLIIIFLFFTVFGMFLYYFLVKKQDFSMIALVIGFLSIAVVVIRYIFMKLSTPLFVVFYRTSISWYIGMMILVVYVVLGIKKIKNMQKI